ncbi:MAG: N-acetylglucosamine-6-phosphate deacetylase, partial [Dermatophilaceae bacterium]
LAAAGRGEAVVELIADGAHVSADVVRMVFDTVGPDAVALVSDAMPATGLGDGSYLLGSLRVTVERGVARTAETGSIAGSTSTLAECVTWAVEVAGVPADDAHRAATVTPARAVGLPV